MRRVTLGLAGCGRLAQRSLARTLARLPGAALVAVADPDASCRQAVARRAPGVRAYADYRDLLADPGVEGVVITLPPALHAVAAVAALGSGKHVYIEKPLAVDLESARAVVREQERTGLVAMLGFNFRYHPLYAALKRGVHGGQVGEVIAVRTVLCAAPRALPAWKTARQTGGGALLDLGSHHIDLVRFVFEQEIAEVAGAVRSMRSEHDAVCLQLRLQRGPIVQSLFSITSADKDRFEVHGDAGWMATDRYRSRTVRYAPAMRPATAADRVRHLLDLVVGGPARLHDTIRPPGDGSHRSALLAFTAAMRSGRSAAIHLADGVQSVAVVTAAEASIDQGVVIRLAPMAVA